MDKSTIKRYKIEVASRAVKCPRCGGWISMEPGMGNDTYMVCVNCGWEKAVSAGQVAGSPVGY